MIEKKHRALASIYLINDAVASNLAMLAAWFLRFHVEVVPVTKGMQQIEIYLSILPIITIVFPLAFAVQGLYRIRPTRSKAEEWMSVAIGSVVGCGFVRPSAPTSSIHAPLWASSCCARFCSSSSAAESSDS